MSGGPPSIVTGPVLDALLALGHATAPQIVAHIGNRYTLTQVRKALSNAVALKRVYSLGHVARKQRGTAGGSVPTTYWLAGTTPPAAFANKAEKADCEDDAALWVPVKRRGKSKAFASVFHYAQGIEATTEAT
jgi:hypothetical protein